MQENNKGSFPPWSRIPSLKEMTEEAGINFDDFINSIEQKASSEDMAEQFNVSCKTIDSLTEHFYKYGISSVIGGD